MRIPSYQHFFFPVLLHVVVYICEKASALMSSAKWITLKLSSLKQYKFIIWRFLQIWNSGVGTCRWFCLCSWGCRQQVSQSRSYLKTRLEPGGPTFPVIQSRSPWAALPPDSGLSVIFVLPCGGWLPPQWAVLEHKHKPRSLRCHILSVVPCSVHLKWVRNPG